MPDWTEIAIDGQPTTDLSGNVTLYEIYDGTVVKLTGRFNDIWMYGDIPTHWKPWVQSAPPTESPELWHEIAVDGYPDSQPFTFCEIYVPEGDAAGTGTTARVYGQWVLPVDPPITVTHWKLPTLSDPPA